MNYKRILWTVVIVATVVAAIVYISNVIVMGQTLFGSTDITGWTLDPTTGQITAVKSSWTWRSFLKLVFDIVMILAPFAVIFRFIVFPIWSFPVLEPGQVNRALDVNRQLTECSSDLEKLADSILKSKHHFSDNTLEEISVARGNHLRLKECLTGYFKNCKAEADKNALKIASLAALSVAISQSSTLDGLATLYWKARLVFETIRIYGFRPRLSEMVRIYAIVLAGALASASIEEMTDMMDIEEVLPKAGGKILSSAIQGAAVAFIVLKTAALTQGYLLMGASKETRKLCSKDATTFARHNFGQVISGIFKDREGLFESFKSVISKWTD